MTTPSENFEAKVKFLSCGHNWPEQPAGIEVLSTHMSMVFRSETFVYKMKKPIRYGPLIYDTLDSRQVACAEEVRINRVLAPSVYLAAVPLFLTPQGAYSLKSGQTVVEWLVKMRRLSDELTLSYQIVNRSWDPAFIEKAAVTLCNFFASQPTAPSLNAFLHRLSITLDENTANLRQFGINSMQEVYNVRDKLDSYLRSAEATFRQRFSKGKIIEGHGDLRTEHIYLEQEPVIVDRLEFDQAYRYVDPFEDLALLTIGCRLLSDQRPADIVLNTYIHRSHDAIPEDHWRFFKAHCALTRCRLAAWHITKTSGEANTNWRQRTAKLLDMATLEAEGITSDVR